MITAGRERARNLLSAACEWAEHSLRMADEAIVSLAMCSEALMKVVPPRSSFSGKRRPRPGGVRNTAKTSSLRTPDEDILGLWRLRSLLHELKSSLFEALSRGEKCVLKLVVGYDVLLFLDSIEEVMHLSAESQMDPDFAARIDLVQVAGPPATTLSATPTAGSCGLHVSWAAFELLEMLGLLVPSRCGPALFLGTIDGAGLEDQLWNRTDGDLVFAIGAILKGMPTAADVIALEQEVARLRGIVNSSEAQKEHSLGPQGVQQHKCAVDVEVQTQNASSSAGTLQRHVPMTPRTPARPSGSSLTACTKKWVTRVVNCGDHRTP
eukprot:s2755_g10.t2